MYAKFFKRLIDFVLSFIALTLLSPILILLIIIGAVAMKGNPFFVQSRPGMVDKNGKEKIFKLLKFRTMSNKRDKSGKLLPDEQRLNTYGKFLRSTSADELPSLINILLGQLAIVGPRPQLVRDMVFMTPEQRRRHSVRPGLTGLAQVNGRNNISWEKKFEWDLVYINQGISLKNDLSIIFLTVKKVFMRDDINREGTASDIDFGDYLLEKGEVDREEYDLLQEQAKELLGV